MTFVHLLRGALAAAICSTSVICSLRSRQEVSAARCRAAARSVHTRKDRDRRRHAPPGRGAAAGPHERDLGSSLGHGAAANACVRDLDQVDAGDAPAICEQLTAAQAGPPPPRSPAPTRPPARAARLRPGQGPSPYRVNVLATQAATASSRTSPCCSLATRPRPAKREQPGPAAALAERSTRSTSATDREQLAVRARPPALDVPPPITKAPRGGSVPKRR